MPIYVLNGLYSRLTLHFVITVFVWVHYPWIVTGGSAIQFLLGVHIAGALIGQILSLSSAVVALLYLWEHRVLKRKPISSLRARALIPPLDLLGRTLQWCLRLGFVFLSATVLSGFAYIAMVPAHSITAKLIWACVVWAFYLSILVAQRVFYLSVGRMAKLSLVGFTMLSVIFFIAVR